MHAHHVIETLEKYAPDSKYKNTADLLSSAIRKANKFHLPDFDALLVSKEEVIRRWSTDPAGFTPPFSICWFDFPSITGVEKKGTIRSSKRGILLASSADDWVISVFSYVDHLRCWMPPIAGIFINIKTGKFGYFSYAEKLPDHILGLFLDDSKGDITHVFNCIYLLNCVNITTQNNPPPEKLNSKRLKRGKVPLYEYKTLVLKPMGKKQTADAAKGLWDNRLHVCRGHFKTYTAEKPLFGRIVGRFWWQAAVRGNAAAGVIEKEYEVAL